MYFVLKAGRNFHWGQEGHAHIFTNGRAGQVKLPFCLDSMSQMLIELVLEYFLKYTLGNIQIFKYITKTAVSAIAVYKQLTRHPH